MDGYEQIGVNFACFSDTLCQRDKIITIACHEGTQIRFLIHHHLELARDRERDILFVGAVTAVRPRILAAMTGIYRNNYQAVVRGLGGNIRTDRILRRDGNHRYEWWSRYWRQSCSWFGG